MTNGTQGNENSLQQAAQLAKNKGAVQQLLRSEDTRRMMDLLNQQGGIHGAAEAAAAGDPSRLMGMMQQLMSSKEGAQLVERITKQAQQSGL